MSNVEDLIEKNQELVDLILKLEKENNELKNSLESKNVSKQETEVKESLQEQVIGERVEDGKYFYIDHDKNIDWVLDNLVDTDNDSYNIFNYFKSEEEAKKYVKHELLSLKLIRLRDKLNGDWIPDWSNNNEWKYFIVLNNNKIINDSSYKFKFSNLYFKTKESREEFLRLIPKEEILEYLRF